MGEARQAQPQTAFFLFAPALPSTRAESHGPVLIKQGAGAFLEKAMQHTKQLLTQTRTEKLVAAQIIILRPL